jgi:hypothetical protein
MTLLFDLPPLPAPPPGPTLSGAERRAHVRHEVDYPAIVRVAGRADLSVRVRDVSAMGALIEPKAGVQVSDAFRLIMADQMFSADCEVRHRTEGRIGVLFTSNRLEAMSRFG